MVILLEKETERLAVGVLHLLYRRAIVKFPSTTRAHPSYMVFVQMSAQGPLRSGYKVFFPFQVAWFIWEQAVFPVLQVLWTRNMTEIGDYDAQVAYVSEVLKAKLISLGYWPPMEGYNIEDFEEESTESNPGLYGNMNWLRIHFELPDDRSTT